MAVSNNTGQIGLGSQDGRVKVRVFRYSFATDGGAVGDITLRGQALPAGALVHDAYVRVTTAVTSGGSATIALKIEGAADLNAADAIASIGALGARKLDKMTDDAARPVTTALRSVVATVGTAALTAGVFNVVVHYTVGA